MIPTHKSSQILAQMPDESSFNNSNLNRMVTASAPSNIALIKYMGKKPMNPSLSYTLEHLRTVVSLTEVVEPLRGEHTLNGDGWSFYPAKQFGEIKNIQKTVLSPFSSKRFLKHFQFLKKEWNLEGHYLIESGNNFPSDCGIASSASSFAALTQAAAELVSQVKNQFVAVAERSQKSQKGSGSSCRSFFSPWSQWDENGAREIQLATGPLYHCVIIVDEGKKTISSSNAHEMVLTSPLFSGRQERVLKRMSELIEYLNSGNWKKAYEICWDEFMDMHELFHTSQPQFSYMTPKSYEVLEKSKMIWSKFSDGPIVTMDAGANIHWLFRQDQLELAKSSVKKLKNSFQVLSSFEVEY